MSKWALIVALAAGSASARSATGDERGVEIHRVAYKGVQLDVVAVDLRTARLRLLWKGPNGERLARLGAARELLERRGEAALAITNAGIYGDQAPVGLHVEDGRELHPISLRSGDGNFFLLPNGVFFLDEHGAGILESGSFTRGAKHVELATQSGPLLLQSGAIHPKFSADSKNALIRSGVGVKSPHDVFLVVSEGPIRFYDLAVFFRDVLHCPDALYLDGTISRLYAPAIGKRDAAGDFMGLLAVTAPAR
jgi:uncharacterized protein YigE (DUF2233 family)